MIQFNITDNAANRIVHMRRIDNENQNYGLRIAVLGGGCSGFQYKYAFTSHPDEQDLLIEHQGAKVFIDRQASPFLENCTLDYIEELGRAGFEIQNPNASAKCGCGNSFAL